MSFRGTTAADQVKAIFRKTYDTGIAHGTVSVRLGEDVYEVTTYRVDGKYSDFRRPDEVSFTTSLREDLKRRDFTINAMAYDPKIGLIDYFQGKQDLSEGRVRCVGDARERFQEDALRMLRALRFAAKLDFSIEAKTYEAMEEKAPLLANISQERICDELTKLLLSDNPWRMRDVVETGLMAYCIPGLSFPFARNSIYIKSTRRGLPMETVTKFLRELFQPPYTYLLCFALAIFVLGAILRFACGAVKSIPRSAAACFAILFIYVISICAMGAEGPSKVLLSCLPFLGEVSDATSIFVMMRTSFSAFLLEAAQMFLLAFIINILQDLFNRGYGSVLIFTGFIVSQPITRISSSRSITEAPISFSLAEMASICLGITFFTVISPLVMAAATIYVPASI